MWDKLKKNAGRGIFCYEKEAANYVAIILDMTVQFPQHRSQDEIKLMSHFVLSKTTITPRSPVTWHLTHYYKENGELQTKRLPVWLTLLWVRVLLLAEPGCCQVPAPEPSGSSGWQPWHCRATGGTCPPVSDPGGQRMNEWANTQIGINKNLSITSFMEWSGN